MLYCYKKRFSIKSLIFSFRCSSHFVLNHLQGGWIHDRPVHEIRLPIKSFYLIKLAKRPTNNVNSAYVALGLRQDRQFQWVGWETFFLIFFLWKFFLPNSNEQSLIYLFLLLAVSISLTTSFNHFWLSM